MANLSLIGLGVQEGDLTVKAESLISKAEKLIVRTTKTESFKQLKKYGKEIISLDYVYEKSRNFDTLNKNLAKEVLSYAKLNDVCYLVDGSVLEDRSCKEILSKNKNVEVSAGVSYLTKTLETLKIVETGVYTVSAYDLISGASLSFPSVIYAVDGIEIASELKILLTDLYGEEKDLTVVSNGKKFRIKTYELDRLKDYNYSTCIYLENKPITEKMRYNYDDLMKILSILRGENGCPWDSAQTPETLRKNLLEETYEFLDALDSEDTDKIVEELGDLLLQTAFYCEFGEEDKSYTRTDVLSGISNKLISRHTHVFGNDIAKNETTALDVWNKNKLAEKSINSGTEYLESVPKNFPSVMRAEKVGGRAQKYNFDFTTVEEVYEKIREEIEEIRSAVLSGDKTQIENECGDLLFSAVNAVRKLGVDGEIALNKSTDKFIKRFSRLEKEVLSRNKTLKDYNQEELDKIYNELKKTETESGN